MGGTHALLAMLDWPPPTEDQLRPRMPARTHTQTPAPSSNTRGGDGVRDRPTDGSVRTPSVRATAFTPAQNNTSTRFAATGGETHLPLALFPAPPATVA
jgi:hypothetical protein